jgi:alpha-glucoside transport system permease protein
VWKLDGLVAATARTAVWMLLVGVISAAGLVAAYLAHRQRGPGPAPWIYRAVLVAPIGVPLVVIGVAVRLLTQPDSERGLFTFLFGWLLGDSAWLAPGPMIMVTLALAFTWMWFGFATVVFRSALARVAPAVDAVVRVQTRTSSSDRQRFREEVRHFRQAYWLPEVRRVAPVVILPMMVVAMRILDLVLVVTPEPAQGDTRVLAVVHWEISGGAVTGESAALGLVWWATVAAAVALVLAWARPGWAWPTDDLRRASAPKGPMREGGFFGTRVWPMVGAAIWCLPVLALVFTSVQAPDAVASHGWRWWQGWALDLGAYADLFRRPYWSAFWSALCVTPIVCVAVVAAAARVVEALDRLRARTARRWVWGLVLLAVAPVQVIANPMNQALEWFERNSPVSMAPRVELALAHVALTVPLAVALLHYGAATEPVAALRSVWASFTNREWTWSPKVYGQRVGRAFRHVWDNEPAVIAIVVLTFVLVWNDFVVGLFLVGGEAETLSLLLFGQTRHFVANSVPLSAGAVGMLVPPVAVVVATHQKVVEGLIGKAEVHG